MRDFSGRGALITGGASGIGFAMAEAFARRGMRLVLLDRDSAALDRAAEALRGAGAEVLAQTLDVTDRAGWARVVRAVDGFGPLHVACANAGVAPGGAPLGRLAPEAFDRIVAVNLTGVFNTVHFALPLIRSHDDGGHLVLTSSTAGQLAAPPIGDYAATKYAVSAMGEALHAELKPEGIGVSVLYPGVVATPLVGESRAIGMDPARVGERVARAIEADELFVFTHADYRPLVEARTQAILAAFGESAEPGFREGPGVLQMMSATAYPPA